ncbi:uncharacterized protein K460DRAFT_281915, partial [Cucurbitaria berberidis CBS 394.84]
ELGFEGLDKVTDKYHDKVYDHLPAWKRKQMKEDQQDQQGQQRSQQGRPDQQQRSSQHPDKGYSRPRSAPSRDENRYEDDAEMYAPDRRQERDYRDANDERSYYNGPNPGAVVPRDRDEPNKARGFEPYQESPQRGYDQGRARPTHQRRGSSWSPPRSNKHERDSHKPRARSRSKDKQHRIIATVGGALVGGFAGNQALKGKKFDTVATIVGAIVGGVGAREASELWDDRRRKRDGKEEEWEGEFGDDRGGDRGDRKKDDRDGRDDRRRDDRDGRDDRRRDDRDGRDDRRREDRDDRGDRRRY